MRKKNIVCFFITIILLSCLVGCENNNTNNKETSSISVPNVETSTNKQQETEKATEQPTSTPQEDLLSCLEYENTDGGIKITNYTGSASIIHIPEIIQNKKVVSIGNTFCGNVVLKELYLPKTITERIDLTGCDSLVILSCPNFTEIDSSNEPKLPDNIKELYLENFTGFDQEGWEFRKLKLDKLYIPSVSGDSLIDSWTAKEVTLPAEYKYYMKFEFTFLCKELFTVENTEDWLIIEDDLNEIYCRFFGNSTVIVNGVTYNYDLNY